jgi:hypothetical protein
MNLQTKTKIYLVVANLPFVLFGLSFFASFDIPYIPIVFVAIYAIIMFIYGFTLKCPICKASVFYRKGFFHYGPIWNINQCQKCDKPYPGMHE